MSTGDPNEFDDDFEIEPPTEADKRDPYGYRDRLLAKLRGGAPPPKQIPIPEHWDRLINEACAAAMAYRRDPAINELYKLDRFDVVWVRGQGGYGLVLEVYDPNLKRNVALKLCRARDDQTAEDLLKEARTLARLKHPNVIAVHEIGRWGDDVFFVMDLAPGKTVYHYTQNEDRTWQEIVGIYIGAGAGLVAAHAEKIIHGDFKPTNVLIEADGSWPRVADFGLARVRREHTPDDEIDEMLVRAGTHGFAAPEVLMGLGGDERSDQWSFCASMWHTLEGGLPFIAASSSEMLEVIEQHEPRVLKANGPQALRDILLAGMAPKPEHRFSDMRALLGALDAVRRPPPRHKGPGWGLMVVAMLLTAATVILVMRGRRDAPHGDESVGRERVSDSTPVQPTTITIECAVEPGESVSIEVLEICRKIRAGKFLEASRDLEEAYDLSDDASRGAMLIVARTLADVAVSLQDTDSERAHDAAVSASDLTRMLGDGHAGVKDINDQIRPMLGD